MSKTKKLIYMLVLSGCLTACGGSGDDAPASKDLFSQWQTADGAWLDLSGLDFGTFGLDLYLAVNVGCSCTVNLTGTQTSGVAYVYSCTHFGPTDYCTDGTVEYTYTNIGGTFQLCTGGSCEVYR